MFYLAVMISLWSSGISFTGQNTPPVFDMKREWLIPEDEPVGRRVTIVRTRDDEGDPIEFGIEPALFLDGSGYFKIDPKSGEVLLASPLIGMAGDDLYLFITANDGHQTAKIEVYIRVLKPSESSSRSVIDTHHVAHHVPLNHVGFPSHPAFRTFSRPPQRPFPPSPRAPTATKRPAESTSSDAPVTPGQNNGSSKMSVSEIEIPHQQNDNEITPVLFPVIATVAFAPVALVILWLIHRRCRMQEKTAAEKKLSNRSMSGLSVDLDSNTNSVPYLQRTARAANSNRYESEETTGVIPEDRKWEFPRHQLRFLCLLDEGCFGQVWKCEALNITRDAEEGAAALVAVKTLKENASEKEKLDLVNELDVMKLLDPHPNVITLLGCCTDRDPLFLIMEFAVYGKLQSYLRERREKRSQQSGEESTGDILTARDLTGFAYQVARGMEYLSSKGIIHRDLAARNILVSESKTCKVADFGFARDVSVSHVYERKSEGCLPIRWMAPESLYDNIYTTMTDVWSFGVLMWEIVTLGSTPYPGMSAADVMRRVKKGTRLEKPEHCGRELFNVMFYCWEEDAQKRPPFQELVRMLDRLMVSNTEYIELDRFPDHSYYNLTSLSGEKL